MTLGSFDDANRPFVIAITGASGAIYAVRLLQVLAHGDVEVHLTISPSGAAVIQEELGFEMNLKQPDLSELVGNVPAWTSCDDAKSLAAEAVKRIDGRIHYHRYDDYMTPIASGSFRTRAMVVCPCSGSTLSGIARAAASNLIQRAAEVHMKEHRKLVLVPRETPMSVLQLENMHRVAQAGAVVLPAMPGWYHGVDSLDSIANFVVARVLDQLDVENDLISRWGGQD